MKKNKISFETFFWSAKEIKDPFEVVDAFFDFAHLDCYKQIISEVILYINNQEVYKKDDPGQVFVLFTALRSFLKACFQLQHKGKKWKIKQAVDYKSQLHQASLTKEEYKNPFAVFQAAFEAKSLDEFEFFLCEIVHLSLSPCAVEFDYDLITPYIHLIKMLDAGKLMGERGLERNQRDKNPSE